MVVWDAGAHWRVSRDLPGVSIDHEEAAQMVQSSAAQIETIPISLFPAGSYEDAVQLVETAIAAKSGVFSMLAPREMDLGKPPSYDRLMLSLL